MGFMPSFGTWGHRNKGTFHHIITTGASGVIASQSVQAESGIIATKTPAKTGRYTLQLPSFVKYRKFLGGFCIAQGPDDAVYGAKTKGGVFMLRANAIDTGAKDGTILLQALNPSTDATNYIDAEVPDSTILFVTLFVGA